MTAGPAPGTQPDAHPGAQPATAAAQPADFPVAWPNPDDARLTWERDDMHMPFPLAPLAVDFVHVIGAGSTRSTSSGALPAAALRRVLHGCAYFAAELAARKPRKTR